ncbi:hypothetical protein DIURU_001094 [Diutina rugosa]|uniref:Fimbrin n=1 Tax=Diutina rugosa TaxID=5481 RepID=A0A642V0D8_DIURU|nr:uncharacterized protein DIURU_001094 [Diutina rugosa]KAA8906356.1 hypothetical protein DIURU_001094 [Diutina rugosa]
MNVLKLQKKYAGTFDQSELFAIIDEFRDLDVDEKGVEKKDVINHVSKKGNYSYDQCRETLKQVDVDASGRVELDDYVDLIAKLKSSSLDIPENPQLPSSPGRVNKPAPPIPTAASNKNKVYLGGKSSGTTHSINDEERIEFTRHINSVLAGDDLVGSRLPFDVETFQIFDECRDGLVLSQLINDSVPDTIDTRVLNTPKAGKQLNNFQMSENANIVINSAKAIGCVVVNVHSDDIIDGKEHLILGIIWQIIRRGLLSKVDIKHHPELYRLLEDDETLEQFLRLPPEQILLRWFNYHLKNAGSQRRVANFSRDISDGEAYTVLLHQLVPDKCDTRALQVQDVNQRAEIVLENADKIGCRKYLTPKSLVAGNPKLNLAFVANLFNTWPGLDPIEEHEQIEIEDFDAEGEREARVFTLWLNSLDVDPTVVSLFEDLKDGLILLQAFEKVMPGTVSFKHVNKKGPNGEVSRFKALENTNYAVEIGKANNFSLVGIEGSDIVDGNKLLTLALVWQLMRRNIVNTLAQLNHGGGKLLTDADMISWANQQVTKGGKSSSVRSFKDESISTGVWLLDVLNGLKPGYVDYDLVHQGPNLTDDEKYANAKLAISIARKIGALIWLVPEDINEVRSRLVLSFIGSLMAVNQ